jgi:hypothetical protein
MVVTIIDHASACPLSYHTLPRVKKLWQQAPDLPER